MYKRHFLWMFVLLVVAVTFLTFRSFAEMPNNAYATEVTAAFIGAVLTAIVTLFLLTHQTASEENKEKNVKIYEAKLDAYRRV